MKKYVLPVLFIVGILVFSLAIYNYNKINTNDDNGNYSGTLNSVKGTDDSSLNSNGGNDTNNNQDNNLNTNPSNSNEGSAQDKSDSGDINNSLDNTLILPDDINTTQCGYYYDEYHVCRGVCKVGVCVSEGRSCYCKK
jgi:hypothetical protein